MVTSESGGEIKAGDGGRRLNDTWKLNGARVWYKMAFRYQVEAALYGVPFIRIQERACIEKRSDQ